MNETAVRIRDAWELIARLAKERADGLSDRRPEAFVIARQEGIDLDDVNGLFDDADRQLAEAKAAGEALSFLPALQLTEESKAKDTPEAASPSAASPSAAEPTKAISVGARLRDEFNRRKKEAAVRAAEEAKEQERAAAPSPDDDTPPKGALEGQIVGTDLPSEAEQAKLMTELVRLYDTEPIKFAREKERVARLMCTNQRAVHQQAMLVRKAGLVKTEEVPELSQASKLIAAGMSGETRLWHDPRGVGYAKVRVDGHWENYRIKGTGFEAWLRNEYGQSNPVRIGKLVVPQAPGSQALRDAVSNLDSYAKFQGDEFVPALRVGGRKGEVWLDLGDADWRAVRVTAGGWEVVKAPGIPFIRSGSMLALPEPVRGGSIQELRPFLNFRAEDFILAVGWLLQAVNPSGPYPNLGLSSASEAGKTTASKMLLWVPDPNETALRKIKSGDDLIVGARNNWALGIDNLSRMTEDMADTFCMLNTGIAVGKRKLYTDDEEHSYVVCRPSLFNGIPVDLTERSDLASRTIRLWLPPIGAGRRLEAELWAGFHEVHPRVLGALLDGVAGALRGGVTIVNPSRMADFEQWAEAGCRAMGFREWEFVKAYRANRESSMEAACQGSPVARAVRALIAERGGYRGKMGTLYSALGSFKTLEVREKDWPKDPTRLSTELRRLTPALAAVGIVVQTDLDLRDEDLGQHGVDISASPL